MRELTRDKIAADIEINLLDLLRNDNAAPLRASVLSYVLNPPIDLRNQILISYETLPVSDDRRVQTIRGLFTENFRTQHPQHKEQLDAIYDEHSVDVAELVGHFIAYQRLEYTMLVYEGAIQIGEDGVRHIEQEITYSDGLVFSTGERVKRDEIELTICQLITMRLAALQNPPVGPLPQAIAANVPVIAPPVVAAPLAIADNNNYAFILKLIAAFNSILSAISFIITVLAIASIIPISSVEIAWVFSAGVVTGLGSFGLYKLSKKEGSVDNDPAAAAAAYPPPPV